MVVVNATIRTKNYKGGTLKKWQYQKPNMGTISMTC